LKAFKKIKFDPFRRRERIKFYYDDQHYVETTIGQLNFFRWFVENDLLAYVKDHYEDIEKDMNVHQKDIQVITTETEPFLSEECFSDATCIHKKETKTRKHLSKSMLKKMTKFNGNTTISFH
jgi:hypothetical protein